jgi:hypothetical protein
MSTEDVIAVLRSEFSGRWELLGKPQAAVAAAALAADAPAAFSTSDDAELLAQVRVVAACLAAPGSPFRSALHPRVWTASLCAALTAAIARSDGDESGCIDAAVALLGDGEFSDVPAEALRDVVGSAAAPVSVLALLVACAPEADALGEQRACSSMHLVAASLTAATRCLAKGSVTEADAAFITRVASWISRDRFFAVAAWLLHRNRDAAFAACQAVAVAVVDFMSVAPEPLWQMLGAEAISDAVIFLGGNGAVIRDCDSLMPLWRALQDHGSAELDVVFACALVPLPPAARLAWLAGAPRVHCGNAAEIAARLQPVVDTPAGAAALVSAVAWLADSDTECIELATALAVELRRALVLACAGGTATHGYALRTALRVAGVHTFADSLMETADFWQFARQHGVVKPALPFVAQLPLAAAAHVAGLLPQVPDALQADVILGLCDAVSATPSTLAAVASVHFIRRCALRCANADALFSVPADTAALLAGLEAVTRFAPRQLTTDAAGATGLCEMLLLIVAASANAPVAVACEAAALLVEWRAAFPQCLDRFTAQPPDAKQAVVDGFARALRGAKNVVPVIAAAEIVFVDEPCGLDAALEAVAADDQRDPQERGAAYRVASSMGRSMAPPVVAADWSDPVSAVAELRLLGDLLMVFVAERHAEGAAAWEATVPFTTRTAAVLDRLQRLLPGLLGKVGDEPPPVRSCSRLVIGTTFAHRSDCPRLSVVLSLQHAATAQAEALEAAGMLLPADAADGVYTALTAACAALLAVTSQLMSTAALGASPVGAAMQQHHALAATRLLSAVHRATAQHSTLKLASARFDGAALQALVAFALRGGAVDGREDLLVRLLHVGAFAHGDAPRMLWQRLVQAPAAAWREEPFLLVVMLAIEKCAATAPDDVKAAVAAAAMGALSHRSATPLPAAVIDLLATVASGALRCGATCGDVVIEAVRELLAFEDPADAATHRMQAAVHHRLPWHERWCGVLVVLRAVVGAQPLLHVEVGHVVTTHSRFGRVLARPVTALPLGGILHWELTEGVLVTEIFALLCQFGMRTKAIAQVAVGAFGIVQQLRLDGVRNGLANASAQPPAPPTHHHAFLLIRRFVAQLVAVCAIDGTVGLRVDGTFDPNAVAAITFTQMHDFVLSGYRILKRCEDDSAAGSDRVTDAGSVIGKTAADSTLGGAVIAAVVMATVELGMVVFCQQAGRTQQTLLLGHADADTFAQVTDRMRTTLVRAHRESAVKHDLIDAALASLAFAE